MGIPILALIWLWLPAAGRVGQLPPAPADRLRPVSGKLNLQAGMAVPEIMMTAAAAAAAPHLPMRPEIMVNPIRPLPTAVPAAQVLATVAMAARLEPWD